jgi:hypothetical protein
MRISLYSWMKAGVGRRVVALTLGAATVSCTGCSAMAGNLTGTTSAFFSTTSTPPSAAANNQQTGAIQTVANVEVTPVRDLHTNEPIAKFPAGVPIGRPAELCTYWDRDLQIGPDPLHNGERMPCLVGRLILLDGKTKEKDICCEGKLRVTLYDDQPPGGGPAVKLEQWDINENNLRKMITKDSLRMWGYTLVMPTATCDNRTTKIHLHVEFMPEGGDPLYSDSGTFKLKSVSSSVHSGQVSAANFHQGQTIQANQAAAQATEPHVLPQIPAQAMPNQ